MNNHFFLSHLCVSSRLWKTRPIEEVAETMMRLGLVHLELTSAPEAPQHYRPDENNSRLFNYLAEAGISVAALRLTGMDYRQKLRAIAEAGGRGIPTVLDQVERLTLPDLIDRLRIYSLCAARAGVHLILENNSYTSCQNAEAQLTLSRLISHPPALGFGFVPPHALADDLDPADEIRRLGKDLRLVYLWDASVCMRAGNFFEGFDPGPPEDQAPGNERGRLNWSSYFSALAEVGFRGIFNLSWEGSEAWSPMRTQSVLENSIHYCRALADEVGLG